MSAYKKHTAAPRADRNGGSKTAAELTEAYGSLLALRAVAAAAIDKDVTHSMLRILCLLAEYVKKGEPGDPLESTVGEHALSARLGVVRSAVNKQIKKLEEAGYITRDGEPGRTTSYIINADHLRDLKNGRAGWNRVQERREQNKAARRAPREAKS